MIKINETTPAVKMELTLNTPAAINILIDANELFTFDKKVFTQTRLQAIVNHNPIIVAQLNNLVKGELVPTMAMQVRTDIVAILNSIEPQLTVKQFQEQIIFAKRRKEWFKFLETKGLMTKVNRLMASTIPPSEADKIEKEIYTTLIVAYPGLTEDAFFESLYA